MVEKRVFTGFESEKFLKKYVPVSKSQLVNNYERIKLKTPLVLKIMSKDAIHKTDIGGVVVVKTEDELEDNYNRLIRLSKKKNLKLDGIMVQEYFEGQNLIIGIKNDPVFGHVVLFGLGGIFTEILDDVSIRKCPINKHDAKEMIEELRAHKLFHGFRGIKLNTKLLEKTLINVSKIPLKNKSIAELDINPFILNSKKGAVIDARIVFN